MTSLADTGHKAGWRGRLVWLALALSLTLNVCFLGGLAWMRLHPPPPPLVRMEHFAGTLNLNDDQHHAFDQFLRTIRVRGRYVRETNQALTDDLWDEIAKPTPDSAAIAKLADQINSNREGFQRDVSAALDVFVKTLSPEQRAQLAGKAKAQDDAIRRFFQMVVP
ncbi:MAG TPA: periplasmic heavy metal sensor [Stellaceae bacterium]|jgi:uncharacterized membrane protein|nr:periplasmic heavy metal sensor [Stellaceae bacterium]